MSRRAIAAVLLGMLLCAADLRAGGETWPTRGWETSPPEAEGMSSVALANLVSFGRAARWDSLLVARHGRLVLEADYAPFPPGMKHTLNSATKTVLGTLVAIATEEGRFGGADQAVVPLFSDRRIAALDDRKRAITVQNLLDMTSGLDWQEPLDGEPRSTQEMVNTPDWVQYVLDRPMSAAPGAAFNYNSGGAQLVSAILAEKVGGNVLEYAHLHLFDPLGITDLRWSSDPQGNVEGGRGLYLLPRDMAKLGLLYLRGGRWEGRRLFAADWIDRVRRAAVVMFPHGPLRYANFFWTLPASRAYMAVGSNSQIILMLPDEDLVAVTTGRGPPWFPQIINGLKQAVKSDGPLPPNPAGEATLRRRVGEAAADAPTDVPPASPLAAAISARRFVMEKNAMEFRTFVLTLTGDHPCFDAVMRARRAGNPLIHRRVAIGLAGTFKVEGEFAYKGSWTDEDTFTLVGAGLEEGTRAQNDFIFNGDQVDVNFQDDGGYRAMMHGALEHPVSGGRAGGARSGDSARKSG